jgi:ribose/xylose/arabinose/galactoside ABC-type transport system permease subunit
MNRTLDIVYWVVGLLASVGAIYYFVRFLTSRGPEGNTTYLWIAIAAAVVACVCALLYFLRHVNKEEEIHITE